MANNFTRVLYEVTSTMAPAYTCPVGATAIVIGCSAANKSNTVPVPITIELNIGAQTEPIVKTVTIPTDATLLPFAGSKQVLTAGDVLQAQTTVTGDVALVLSVLEIT
jgi:hypothetical protein